MSIKQKQEWQSQIWKARDIYGQFPSTIPRPTSDSDYITWLLLPVNSPLSDRLIARIGRPICSLVSMQHWRYVLILGSESSNRFDLLFVNLRQAERYSLLHFLLLCDSSSSENRGIINKTRSRFFWTINCLKWLKSSFNWRWPNLFGHYFVFFVFC